MAHSNRVIGLLVDEKCKLVQVIFETCPTDFDLPKRVDHDQLLTFDVTPDKLTTVNITCPVPEGGVGMDPEDPPVVPPNFLYVGYNAHGTPSSGAIYRHTFTPPNTIAGIGVEVVKFPANQVPVFLIVDQDNDTIIVYINETNTSSSFLRKYNLAGTLQATFATFTGNPLPGGLAMFRTRQEFVVTQVPVTIPSVLVYDYDYVLQRTLDTRAGVKGIAPTDNWPDDDEVTWIHYKAVAGPDEKRWHRSDITGGGASEVSTDIPIADPSGERYYARADVRSGRNYLFFHAAIEGNIYRTSYTSPGTLDVIAGVAGPPSSGHGLAMNPFSEHIAFADGEEVKQAPYLGGTVSTIVNAITGSPRVECLCFGI